MNNISKFPYCYGCGVCAAACARKAISMQTSEDGFYIPKVKEFNCTECGICLDTCAFNHDKAVQDENFLIQYYAAWSKNPEIRQTCTSGGVGFEIGRFLISKGYRAIVCRYNPETKRAEHYVAETEEQLRPSIGSKYIQSDSFKGFSQIKKGEKYFITGSPCQIDSIRRWVRKRNMEDDVILLDFFCHGVPSMLIWDKYIKEVEQKIGQFDDIVWRDKETGWHDSWVMKVHGRYSSWFSKGDLFYKMFLGDRCLGLQCYYNCKYKYDKSAADIRIGDLWGRKYARDEKGVNGVVCYSPKGVNLLNEMNSIFYIEPSTIDVVGESQMKKCAHKPISHKYVMKSIKTGELLSDIDKTATRIELLERVPRRINYYLFRFPSKLLEVIGMKAKPEV